MFNAKSLLLPGTRIDLNKSYVVAIGPKTAKVLLENAARNRPTSHSRVEMYARDMESGHWVLNDTGIAFDLHGKLANGRHRMEAVVRAGMIVEFRSLFDQTPEQLRVTDQGRRRSIGDQLAIDGTQNANATSAAAVNLCKLATGLFGLVPSASEISDVLKYHPRICDSVALCHNLKAGAPSQFAAIHYIGHVVQDFPLRADAFINVFRTAVPDYDGDPAHLMVRKFLSAKNSRTSLQTKLRLMLLVKAWELFKYYNTAKILRVSEEFEPIPGWNIDTLFPTTRTASPSAGQRD
jgi:hypothetical protein